MIDWVSLKAENAALGLKRNFAVRKISEQGKNAHKARCCGPYSNKLQLN
jgi:hypothetical protein